MLHPLFYKRSIFFSYLAIWIVVYLIVCLLLYIHYDGFLVELAQDTAIACLIFCVQGIIVWFAIRYTHYTKKKKFNEFFNLFSVGVLFILIWNALHTYAVELLFADNIQYLEEFDRIWLARIISGSFLFIILSQIYYIIRFYIELEVNHKNELKLREEVKDAELMALKAQINPHFLFNSLNSLSSLALFEGEKAHEMIIKLSDYLRYSISKKNDELTTLTEELENVKRYLDIEKVRFEEKLEYSFSTDIPEANTYTIPQLILQPLYENAVKHGVYDTIQLVRIETEIALKYNAVEITIKNNFDSETKAQKGTGIGLKNIKDRLLLMYKNDNLLKIEKHDSVFKVRVLIPQKTGGESEEFIEK